LLLGEIPELLGFDLGGTFNGGGGRESPA